MSDRKDSILVIGAGRAAAAAAEALRSESWSVRTLDALSELGSATHHPVIVFDTHGLTEPPADVIAQLRDADPHAAILMLVQANTPWASFASYRRRPEALVLEPIERTTLSAAIDSALVYRKLLEENRNLKRQLSGAVSASGWVGCTPPSQAVRQSIATAAIASGTVAILGEDGSGRRLAAELIHNHSWHLSRDAEASFLPIDLTSLPEGELGSVLREARDSAAPGTLYLAELTALGTRDQVALKAFVSEPRAFRLMVSAHPSIDGSVGDGDFDASTFAAVSKLRITIPPLRGRRDDIPVLIDHFLKQLCPRFGLGSLGMASSCIANYSRYDWPGNVRELAAAIERAVSIASVAKFDGTTLPQQFCSPPSSMLPPVESLKDVSLREHIADIEKRIIVETLERVDGSQRRAAKELRLNPTTLHEKMKRYKILPERNPPRA